MTAATASNGNHVTKKTPQILGGGCNWIPWDAQWVQSMPDPTRMFSILVLGIIIFKYLAKYDWDFSLLLFGFVLNPYVIFSFGVSITVFQYGGGLEKFCALPVYDRWACEWYFWNAALYHMIMDGFTGTFGVVPLVLHQYQQLDYRFVSHHSVPWTVGLVELTTHSTFCLLSMWAILKNKDHPVRYPAELITGTLHIFGMVVFLIAEVYEGQLNVPANDPVGVEGDRWGNLKVWDMDQLTYYWFGFWICNNVWLVVPYYRMVRAFDEIHQRFSIPIKRD
jgi:hypothetical protein